MKNEKLINTKKRIEDFIEDNSIINEIGEKELERVIEIRVTSFDEGLKVSKLFREFMGNMVSHFYLYTYDDKKLRELHKLRLKTLTLLVRT